MSMKLMVAGRALAGTGMAALALAVAAPAGAQTTTLTFSGAICGAAGNAGCGDGSQIGQNYGDSAFVDLAYRSITASTGATYEPYLKHWASNYGDLTNVVWGGANGANYISEIVFTPAAGYEISLTGFSAGCYLNRVSCRTFPYTITSLGGTAIAGATTSPPPGGHTTVNVGSAYFGDGIRLQWGPDGYDGGLDDITFNVRAIMAGGGVPEPASWALMILGFGAVGGALRRRPAMRRALA